MQSKEEKTVKENHRKFPPPSKSSGSEWWHRLYWHVSGNMSRIISCFQVIFSYLDDLQVEPLQKAVPAYKLRDILIWLWISWIERPRWNNILFTISNLSLDVFIFLQRRSDGAGAKCRLPPGSSEWMCWGLTSTRCIVGLIRQGGRLFCCEV